MGHAVTVYAVAALLVAASAGPVLANVRDASLLEFESLDEPRSISDFPMLERMRPYLPPMIVDWLIIQKPDLDVPEGVQFSLDPDGRWILTWPDGCKETEEEHLENSRCAAEEEEPDCEWEPLHPECRDDPVACDEDDENATDEDCPVEECPRGEIFQQGSCVPDPACEQTDPGSRPSHCPHEEAPPCPDGQTLTVYGECIPTVTHRLTDPITFSGSQSDEANITIELVAHYNNLSVELTRDGFPFSPGWTLELRHNEESRTICFRPRDDPQTPPDCEPGQTAATDGGTLRLVDDPDQRPHPPGNLTLKIDYNPNTVTTSGGLEVRLYGRPTVHDAG